MSDHLVTVLLIEEDPADAELVQNGLPNTKHCTFRIEWVTRISDAIERLGLDRIDVILLDLSLPDGHGMEAFDRVFEAAPHIPIIVLGAVGDEETARQITERGAYDHLAKSRLDAYWLPRALSSIVEQKIAEDARRTSEARLRAMSDASPLGIFVSDSQGRCEYTNAAYQTISGLTANQTLGKHWSMAIHPEDRQPALSGWQDAAQDQKSFQCEVRFLRQDGTVLWARLNIAALGDGATTPGHVHTVEDITERKKAEGALRAAEETLFEEKERAQVTLNSIGDAVLTTDLLGKVTYLNQVAETLTGWSHEVAVGRPLPEVFKIIDGETRKEAVNPAQRAIEEDKTVELAIGCVLIGRDGAELMIEDSAAPIHDREGRVSGAVIVFHEASQSRVVTEKMSHLARHDFLTGLPNRVLLRDRLTQAIRLARRNRKSVGLLYLDLDRFKHVNDSLGHEMGDRLLQAVGHRLVACVRATDTVCREGGDEFVILLSELEHPGDANGIADKVLTAFKSPLLVGEHEFQVTTSIGISLFPDDDDDAEGLLQKADTAMYQAKASGLGNCRFFSADMSETANLRLSVEVGLHRALRKEEFLLHYQPKIELSSGAMNGVEALVRWQKPDRGLVYPAQFMPLAEERGLIVPIGRWVLREACRQARAWQDSDLRVVPVSVNVSAMEFSHESFLEEVALILKETRLEPCHLELELTETALMHDLETSVAVLHALNTIGVQLALDDFGTGYSSLSYLKRFPIDTLKIDQSFVRDIATGLHDTTIVNAVIQIGRDLDLRVIAEGVETHEQLEVLRALRCESGQGFLFSRPLPAEDITPLLCIPRDDLSWRRLG